MATTDWAGQLAKWRGKRLAVYGLGRSGLAVTDALIAAGAEVWAWDDQPAARPAVTPNQVPIDYHDLHRVNWKAAGISALVISPGINPLCPMAFTAYMGGAMLTNDIDLFAQSQPAAAVVGVTGTNGKSTTTALIHHLLQQAGVECAIGGNFGTAVFDLPVLSATGVYVLELSSYQLELLRGTIADIGVFLNLSPDHLERHRDMLNYRSIKQLILQEHDRPRPHPQANVIGINDRYATGLANWYAEMYEAGECQRPVDRISGLCRQDADIFPRNGWLTGWLLQYAPLIDLKRLTNLPGPHNAQNVAAAVAVGLRLGLSRAQLQSGLQSFPGLPHRQEWVGSIAGMACINDSKATNAAAAAKALACYKSILWIAGGRPKLEDMRELIPPLPRLKHSFLIGEATAKFADFLTQHGCSFVACDTLDQALAKAVEFGRSLPAKPATTILLSPACASFDQYRNFEERGDHFRQLVQAFPHHLADTP
jgi:UDP-N-acetylmuramoylalanine--D-glutamate ligase